MGSESTRYTHPTRKRPHLTFLKCWKHLETMVSQSSAPQNLHRNLQHLKFIELSGKTLKKRTCVSLLQDAVLATLLFDYAHLRRDGAWAFRLPWPPRPLLAIARPGKSGRGAVAQSVSTSVFWGVPKSWGYPPNHPPNHPYFIGIFPYQPSILGYPH